MKRRAEPFLRAATAISLLLFIRTDCRFVPGDSIEIIEIIELLLLLLLLETNRENRPMHCTCNTRVIVNLDNRPALVFHWFFAIARDINRTYRNALLIV